MIGNSQIDSRTAVPITVCSHQTKKACSDMRVTYSNQL